MTVILIRTVLIYLILLVTMRCMGKRQVGELEISDLVITLLISEIATLPLTDTDIPLLHAIVPIVTLLTLEVTLSMLIACFPRLKNLLTVRPATLIKRGSFCQKELRNSRISADELIGELRQQGITDISEVDYAILEQNGRLTAIQKSRFRPPSAQDLGIAVTENGIFHIVIDKGVINKHALRDLCLTEKALHQLVSDRHLRIDDVYLLMINDGGEVRTIRKDRKA